ncbi:MAG: gephyrin-like molybdotransferase Glp [Bacillota bacterium]|uniref:molybdopterin molybdotransferase MoeA n=1 Tax=Carboxydocella sp. ULO1 TaxID=1926599 RepID=UPI0009ACB6DE|nr:gephyrin-like molybdotransferase Glp [Carboxydocella sp. ULO1]AVX31740.1 molybdopterin molybdochelatase [Carboxydocella thermautotrophica]GAW29353.1 molybdenum cofactor biosynthesis protein [Carboxydocella sp. ULO1]
MAEFGKVITVPEALARLEQHLQDFRPRPERVPLLAARGRVLAEKVVSPTAVPGFYRSTVDGYAVRGADTFGATEDLPVFLPLVGEVLMGQAPPGPLPPGSAMAISTGGMLPEGADAIVMLEYTEMAPGMVAVLKPVAPGENVVRPGEDVTPGQEVLPAGRRLRAQDLGLLAGLGITEVTVAVKPRVALISTGDEIVAPEQEPGPGQVRDMNSYTLYALVDELGGEPRLYGVIRDQKEQLLAVARQALEENDVLIVSGGSSVGTRDATGEVLASLGEPGVFVHGISVRPGKPTILARCGQKLAVGLPGHPVSAMVTFDLFLRPILRALLGLPAPAPYRDREGRLTVTARLERNVLSGPAREDHVRCALEWREGELWAVPILGKSSLLSTMVKADGILRIPLEQDGISAGELVSIGLFEEG